MPGEAQKIERLMEVFSQRYCYCNPNVVRYRTWCFFTTSPSRYVSWLIPGTTCSSVNNWLIGKFLKKICRNSIWIHFCLTKFDQFDAAAVPDLIFFFFNIWRKFLAYVDETLCSWHARDTFPLKLYRLKLSLNFKLIHAVCSWGVPKFEFVMFSFLVVISCVSWWCFLLGPGQFIRYIRLILHLSLINKVQ